MTNLAPADTLCLIDPLWGIEIFSNRWSNRQAYADPTVLDPVTGQPVDVGDVDHEWDTSRAGWIRFYPNRVGFYDINIKWDIRTKPTGDITVDKRTSWIFGLDMIEKCKALIYYEMEGGMLADITVFPTPSNVVFYIDSIGIDNCFPHGTVSVTGQEYFTGELVTEEVAVRGDGVYVSQNVFTIAYSFGANLNGEDNYQGGKATMSVWARTCSNVGMREVRLYCDGNNDGCFGLVFGGFIKGRFGEGSYDEFKVTYDLMGYAEAMQLNEYIAGYRAAYRCSYFAATGEFGDCTNTAYKDACFRKGGSSCYVGDWDTVHHSGIPVFADGYRCHGYSADDTQPLAYDGWTYDPNYAPTDETGYAWYPYDYYLALKACCDVMNSIEEGKAFSRPWSLPLATQVELAEDLDEFEDIIDLTWDRAGSLARFRDNSFLECEGEVMLILVGASNNMMDSYAPLTVHGTSIGVQRAVENSLRFTHPAGTIVNIPLICWSGKDEVPPKLVMNPVLQEPELKHTVWDTLKSYEELATSYLVDAPYVAWVDNFRQIQFTEMDVNRPTLSGYDDYFQILPEDIIEQPTYVLSGVCNRVVGQVDLDNSNWVYAEMSVNSPGLENYTDSMKLFGIVTEEVSNVHLRALQPTTGKADFQSYAFNYLKLHAFPRLTQHIAICGFVPDEHDWDWVTDIRNDANDHRYDPYLRETDPINHHINLLGCKVYAPDFWLGRDEDGDWYESEFIVEGIRWISKVEGYREFVTYLTIARPTLPGEWTL